MSRDDPYTGKPHSACIIRLSAIGDCCHNVPVLRTLQAAWPETQFTWIIGKAESTLLGDIPDVEFIVLDKRAGLRGYQAVFRALRGRSFDLLLHMHASMRANIISMMVSAPYRLGFDRARARDRQWLFSNHRIPVRPGQHVMDGLFEFAHFAGVRERVLRWDIPLSASDRAMAAQIIESDKPALLISPCSSQRFRNFRNWSAANYARVADYAAQRHGMQIILTGGNSSLERDYAALIAELSSQRPVDLIGQTTLKQLLALIGQATVVLCPDSGPAHMATAMATPVIGLYATSNPGRTGPYRSQQWVVNKYPEALIADGRDIDKVRWGARVRNPRAMDLIEVSDVTAKLDQIMASVLPTEPAGN